MKNKEKQNSNQQITKAVALALSLTLSSTASAATFEVLDNIADPTRLTNGTYNGSFDINSVLSPPEDYNTPYEINSAMVIFSFSDDYDPLIETYTYTTYREGGNSSGGTNTYYLTTTYEYNPDESATLGIAGAEYNKSTDYYESSFTSRSSDLTSSYWGGVRNYNVYESYLRESGYDGDFVIAQALEMDNLDQLFNTGTLGFDLDVTGDLYLNNARLVFDIDKNPVPEAGSSLLFLTMGLAGLGLSGARRKKNNIIN